eukprot:gb/GFBE01078887.1/.p1 GENE.gb/GFBE01078887.1/~~gb/GFBE01078887.1/.p1  ORF type:complete len:269 (+),score=17.01 gb/GFBE01078887.1/:1-807(+)
MGKSRKRPPKFIRASTDPPAKRGSAASDGHRESSASAGHATVVVDTASQPMRASGFCRCGLNGIYVKTERVINGEATYYQLEGDHAIYVDREKRWAITLREMLHDNCCQSWAYSPSAGVWLECVEGGWMRRGTVSNDTTCLPKREAKVVAPSNAVAPFWWLRCESAEAPPVRGSEGGIRIGTAAGSDILLRSPHSLPLQAKISSNLDMTVYNLEQVHVRGGGGGGGGAGGIVSRGAVSQMIKLSIGSVVEFEPRLAYRVCFGVPIATA